MGIPKDPSPNKLSGNCDGANGTTYGYDTYKKQDGSPGFYLIANLETRGMGNSSIIPDRKSVNEEWFTTLRRGQGRYYIISD
jgi:hypothetical protein